LISCVHFFYYEFHYPFSAQLFAYFSPFYPKNMLQKLKKMYTYANWVIAYTGLPQQTMQRLV